VKLTGATCAPPFASRRQAFRALHQEGCFVIPNPWDVGSVRYLQFNLLVVRDVGLDVAAIAALGVRRISVGGALALSAWTGFMRAAQRLKSDGSFAGLAALTSYADINELFTADLQARHAVPRQMKGPP
jgi:2-methylisocitrate lyase-like PEP mutase family enzyme